MLIVTVYLNWNIVTKSNFSFSLLQNTVVNVNSNILSSGGRRVFLSL